MEMAGTPCPFMGKIGIEAQQEWDSLDDVIRPKIRPVALEQEAKQNEQLKGAAKGVGFSLLLLLLL
jgi:hypothetical protein